MQVAAKVIRQVFDETVSAEYLILRASDKVLNVQCGTAHSVASAVLELKIAIAFARSSQRVHTTEGCLELAGAVIAELTIFSFKQE